MERRGVSWGAGAGGKDRVQCGCRPGPVPRTSNRLYCRLECFQARAADPPGSDAGCVPYRGLFAVFVMQCMLPKLYIIMGGT